MEDSSSNYKYYFIRKVFQGYFNAWEIQNSRNDALVAFRQTDPWPTLGQAGTEPKA